METLIKIYNDLFPQTTLADWFYAFMGLLVHLGLKMKNIPFKHFKWSLFLEEFLPVWYMCMATIIICVGTLPHVMDEYSTLDSALIGYGSSSFFKQLFKFRLSKLGIGKATGTGKA